MGDSTEPLLQWAQHYAETYPTRMTSEVQARLSDVLTGFGNHYARLRQQVADNEHSQTLLQSMEAMDLSDRPRLDGWSIVTAQTNDPDPYLAPELRPTALAGTIHKHPLKTDGDTVTTSVLRFLHYGHGGGVAVTASRAYMLGGMDPEYAAYRAERGLSTTEMVVPEPNAAFKRKHESLDDEEEEAGAPVAPGSPTADAERAT